jgi:hypothetical protein
LPETGNSLATKTPSPAELATDEPQKPRRSRAINLTGVDQRTVIGKRISELRAIYTAALGGVRGLSPIKRMKIDDAAQLRALAERARGNWARDSLGCLDDVVRIERKATLAESALGIVDQPPNPTPSRLDAMLNAAS